MTQSKYGNILTIVLVVLIVIILIIGTVFLVKWLRDEKVKKDNERVISQITAGIEDEPEAEEKQENTVMPELTNINQDNQTNNENSAGTRKKKIYMNGFVVSGYIEIPKTGIKYAILETSSIKALETAVAIVYPSGAKLNTQGNVVIQGHNYRNGKFFSNNKKLKIGDKIKVTDTNNNTLTYTIYEIFETTPEDAAYFTRDTGDNIEISLSTCTDDGKGRLVILARV